MPEYSHLPFGGGAKSGGSHGANRAKQSEDEHARMSEAEARQHQERAPEVEERQQNERAKKRS